MKSMIHAIRIWWTGSAVIANASGRSFIIAANAVSNSMRGLTLTEMTVTPNVGAAACISSNWRTLEALSGFQRKATLGWNSLLENLQPLGTDVRAKDGIAGDISSRSGEAWHEPGAHGIADRDHDDGNRGGGLLGRQARGRGVGRNNIHRATNERRRGLCQPLRHSVTILVVEGDVAAFEVAEIAQPVSEGVPDGRVVDDANARNFRRLLPARTPHLDREQQADTTDQRSELTPSHVGHGMPPAKECHQ